MSQLEKLLKGVESLVELEAAVDLYLAEQPKAHRRKRIRINRKLKLYDKVKAKGRAWEAKRWIPWSRRFERDYTFNRVKAPTDTGYGVAYEKRVGEDW